MLNSDSQKSSNLEESKENKADVSKETEILVDDMKKPSLPESNSDAIKVSQNSNAQTGKDELLDHSIIFHAITPLHISY